MLATLLIKLHLPGCTSLKEKRSRIKPLLSRLHREFNLSTAELDAQDAHHPAIIGCAMIGSGRGNLEASLQAVAKWVEGNWPDGMVVEQKIEIIG